MNIQNHDISPIISNFFTDDLKSKSPKQIVNEFPEIKNRILKFLDLIATQQNLNNEEKQLFIEDLFNKIKINGLPLKIYQENWEKENEVLIQYKELYNVANKLDIFTKKTIKIIVNNKELDIEVLDTGKKYIPSSNIELTKEIIETLNNLKNQENEILNKISQDFFKEKNEMINQFNSSIALLTNNDQEQTSFRI